MPISRLMLVVSTKIPFILDFVFGRLIVTSTVNSTTAVALLNKISRNIYESFYWFLHKTYLLVAIVRLTLT